jgi:hypothetical protein
MHGKLLLVNELMKNVRQLTNGRGTHVQIEGDYCGKFGALLGDRRKGDNRSSRGDKNDNSGLQSDVSRVAKAAFAIEAIPMLLVRVRMCGLDQAAKKYKRAAKHDKEYGLAIDTPGRGSTHT